MHARPRSLRLAVLAPAFAGIALLQGAAAQAAHALDWELDLDARLVDTRGGKSWLEGGFTRYGADQHPLQLGRARLGLAIPIAERWKVVLDASAYDRTDKGVVGITEAYLQFRPYPFEGWRVRARAGAFYAPVSLENREAGWESPYTLSWSAMNSWIAEELRTVGVETRLDWLGRRLGHEFEAGLVAAAYGWNEGAGTLIAEEGFALHDRQSSVFGRVGRPGVAPFHGEELFHQIDRRPGWYGGGELRWLDQAVLRVLHYDNRADPAAYDAVRQDLAWHTRFDAVGLRGEDGRWTGIVQWLQGDTLIAPPFTTLRWPFRTWYALLARSWGGHSLALRYDEFRVDLRESPGVDAVSGRLQDGHAITAAYVYRPGPHWRFTLEWLRARATTALPADYSTGIAQGAQRQLQFSVRYALGPGVE